MKINDIFLVYCNEFKGNFNDSRKNRSFAEKKYSSRFECDRCDYILNIIPPDWFEWINLPKCEISLLCQHLQLQSNWIGNCVFGQHNWSVHRNNWNETTHDQFRNDKQNLKFNWTASSRHKHTESAAHSTWIKYTSTYSEFLVKTKYYKFKSTERTFFFFFFSSRFCGRFSVFVTRQTQLARYNVKYTERHCVCVCVQVWERHRSEPRIKCV